jgi:DNA-binding NarL/FixJ family response regulator
VLIADDHTAVRRGVRSILLSRPDVTICAEASDGREAVDHAIRCRPDLIILDLTMPRMGGFEAAKMLRTLLPDIPILFYSMHDSQQVIRDAKALGVHGFLCKSEISAMLLEALEALVDRKATFFPDSTRDVETLV